MTETDLDTKTEPALEEQETEARLPWESIDPDEAPASFISPFASTAGIAVEAREVESTPSPLSSPILIDRFARLEGETAASLSDEEREEQLADRAFFSDRKISIEMMGEERAPQAEPLNGERSDRDAFLMSAPEATSGADAGVTEEASSESPFSNLHSIRIPELHKTDADEEIVVASIDADSVADAPTLEIAGELASDRMTIDEPSPNQTANDFTPFDANPTAGAPLEANKEVAENIVAPIAFFDASTMEVVERTIPLDAINQASVTYSAGDTLEADASQLASLAESFALEEVDHAEDPALLISVTGEEEVAGFAIPRPQEAVQLQPIAMTEVDLEPELEAAQAYVGGGWTIPLMCMGIGLIACCMVIPQGESNRKLRYEQASLASNLEQVQKQVAVNDEFLKKVMDDPTLAERLAGRQMKTIRKGQKVIELQHASDDTDMSPFSLVAVAKAAELPPYKPRTSTIASLCNNARSRLYLLGSALAMVAVGLVMGFGAKKVD